MAVDSGPDLRLLSTRSPQVCVRHPDTREARDISVAEFVFRIEKGLGVETRPEWLPILAAMADGLYMQPGAVLHRARAGRGLRLRAPDEGAPPVDWAMVEAVVAAGAVRESTVEAVFRQGEWSSLMRPRTWELNGWWESLYGLVPMPPAPEDDDDPDESLAEEIEVGSHAFPYSLQSEDNQVRHLLERGVIRQEDPLFRLRVSIYEQERALGVLRAGYFINEGGELVIPAEGEMSEPERQALILRSAEWHRGERRFSAECLPQLVRLGLARQLGLLFISAP